jgi:hypothetical protein
MKTNNNLKRLKMKNLTVENKALYLLRLECEKDGSIMTLSAFNDKAFNSRIYSENRKIRVNFNNRYLIGV